MSIDKLVEEGGTLRTTTFLRVGSVSASVKSAEGGQAGFQGSVALFDGFGSRNRVHFRRAETGRHRGGGQPCSWPSSAGNFCFFRAAQQRRLERLCWSPRCGGRPDQDGSRSRWKRREGHGELSRGASSTTSSGDLSSLQQSSGQVQSLPTAPTTPTKTATTGGVTLTIQFGP